ncbi:MAG TPA: SusD/RagB family nutrient-binding outer membrane lipoprotein [Bacteroidales bacterium]|nr:SusD/RagB family nutrient-binding outer membrane lipoprotein [Bacteroidales bacterium]
MKKYRTLKIVSLLFMFVLGMNACTEKFEEMNTDPSLITPELINVNLIMTYVQSEMLISGSDYGNGTTGSYCGMTVRADDRPFQEGDAPGSFYGAYGTYINNLAEIIYLTRDDADLVNKKAIARIMKVWAFANLTDTYGDVPYFEACLPKEEAVFAPKYDPQEDIYKDLLKELKEAAAELDASKESYGGADLIYGGDVSKWKKLANSLRLRYALRVRFADAALAQSNMSDLTEADLITSRAEDAHLNNSTDYPDHRNPRYNRIIDYGPDESVAIGKTLLDILINNETPLDPRIGVYADTASASFPGTPGYEDVEPFGYRGQPLLGLVPVENKYPYQAKTISEISQFWRVPVVDLSIIRSSEVYFALAEARLFNLISFGDANTFYQKGIDAAILWAQDFYNLVKPQAPALLALVHDDWSEAEINTYIDNGAIAEDAITAFKAAPVYALTGTDEEKFEQIINQKLVSFYPDEFQGWCEYRRTGYPRILIGPDEDDLKGVIPRRMPWPTGEDNLNSTSIEEAKSRFGGKDNRLVKFWWDANPDAPHVHPGTVEWRTTPWI